ncbi:MAG: adenylate/guanylate cyclase domain-containing protein [bacterium]|nr:adenylate/guanylate cyclase domain-containing protein [bacterium]
MAGETILVVDDGRENREFVVEYVLEPNGYEPLTAKDGREGLELAVKHRPDLILLDLNMPRMDGVAVLKKLVEYNLDIPVILMTFHGSEEIAVEVYRLGVKDYVKKPYSVDEMEEAITRALSETRLRKEKEALTERVLHANRELQLRLQELNVLYSLGKNVTALLDMQQLLPRVVDAAVQITHAEQGHLYLLENGRLICRAQKKVKAARAQFENLEAKDPVALHVVNTGQAISIDPEHATNNRTLPGTPLAASYTPLMIAGELVGVLGVENVSPRATAFSHHESSLLSVLGDYAAIAIANSRNYEALRVAKERETSHLRGTFERFVPPSVVERVINQPDSLKLGGKRQEISVLFADIRGYTAWSENAPPEQVVEVLNHYLSMAAEVILSWEGTLDKFFGDGLMAIFNAPDSQADHVHRAADAALALMKAANEVNSLYGHRLSYSIGVHVGEAVVGYIGTDRAVNYTAIGDVVNLAKRLQEYAAPGQILVEEATIRRLGNMAQARPLGELKVKGRKQTAFAYELVGLAYPSTP